MGIEGCYPAGSAARTSHGGHRCAGGAASGTGNPPPTAKTLVKCSNFLILVEGGGLLNQGAVGGINWQMVRVEFSPQFLLCIL